MAMFQPSTDWVTLLATCDRRGRTSGSRMAAPADVIWKVALPDAVRSSPIFDGNVLYVTCRDGRVRALDSGTGRERWNFLAGAACDSTPALSGNLILFGCDDGSLYAVERASGQVAWRAEGGGARL